VEELATGSKFQHNVVVLPRLGEVDELDDVGVVELTHDLHLLEDVGTLQTASQSPATRMIELQGHPPWRKIQSKQNADK
jgi:hypothetical protein